jgi:uroporphyrinogen-III synthase
MRVWQAEKTYAVFAGSANKKIISGIENSGANIVLFPLIETKEIEPDTEINNSLTDFETVDWIVFPDVYAVEYFLNALEKSGKDFFELDYVQICAFGETVSDRLRFVQIHADVISNTSDSNGVFKALNDFDSFLNSARFLIPKEETTNLELTELLKQTGAETIEIPVYKVEILDHSRLPKLKALIKGGAIDEFVFCSPAEILNLAFLLYPHRPFEWLSEIGISATEPTTAQSLREFGFTKIKIL